VNREKWRDVVVAAMDLLMSLKCLRRRSRLFNNLLQNCSIGR